MIHSCTASTARAIGDRERQVRIELTPCRVTPNEAPNLVLVNEGGTDLGYSVGFSLEKKTSPGWRLVNRRQGFPLPLFYLHPGESSEPQPVEVYFDEPRPVRLTPGVYRVTKSINLKPGEPRPPTMDVSIRFRVQAPG